MVVENAPPRRTFASRLSCGLALAVVVVLAAPVRAASPGSGQGQGDGGAPSGHPETSYYSTRGILAEFFPHSERVTYRTFALDAATRARLSQRLGYAPARDRYTVFVATTQGKVD